MIYFIKSYFVFGIVNEGDNGEENIKNWHQRWPCQSDLLGYREAEIKPVNGIHRFLVFLSLQLFKQIFQSINATQNGKECPEFGTQSNDTKVFRLMGDSHQMEHNGIDSGQ